MHTSSIALLNFFDLGDMPGILSAWSVRTCECRSAREMGTKGVHGRRLLFTKVWTILEVGFTAFSSRNKR